MLISNGWTDDLFPPDEAIRFYNRTRAHHPGTPISLIFSDHGHQRGQNKAADATFRNAELHAWFDHYVKGTGPLPFEGVQTLTQTCPDTAASGGAGGAFDDPDGDAPFSAATWSELAPGEVRLQSAPAQTIAPGRAVRRRSARRSTRSPAAAPAPPLPAPTSPASRATASIRPPPAATR